MSKGVLRSTALMVAAVVLLVGLASCRPVPASGRYSTQIYTDAQLTTVSNVVYATVENAAGTMINLGLDLYLPPADAGRQICAV